MLTDEQIKQRLGLFSGSQIYRLMGKKGLGKTGETYIFEVASEILTGQKAMPEFTMKSTDWGNEHEPEAMKYYEAATGSKIAKSETIKNNLIVGTPDGIVDNEFLIEIKCPYNSGNHLKNLKITSAAELYEVRPEYFWQMQAYFWLTGLRKGKFCSYDPRFHGNKRMFILNIESDDMSIELMKSRINEANEIKNKLIN